LTTTTADTTPPPAGGGRREPLMLPPGDTPIGPERQLSAPKEPTAKERYAARKAAQAEAARLKEIQDGIAKTDRELAAGTHKRRISKDDLDWLNADPRRKEIAYDPDLKTYRVEEAKLALAAEEAKVLPGPVSRATEPGTDLLDGSGAAWSAKATGPSATVESTAALIAGEALAGRRCLGDLRLMSMKEQAGVRTLIVDQLKGTKHAEIRFLPPGVEGIRPQ
jgi:hypothetical protein